LDSSPSFIHLFFLTAPSFWFPRGERKGSPSGTGNYSPGREAASTGGEDGD